MDISDESSDGIFPADIWKRLNSLLDSVAVLPSDEEQGDEKSVQIEEKKPRRTRKLKTDPDKSNNSGAKISRKKGKRIQKRKKIALSDSESEKNENLGAQSKRERPIRKCRIKKRVKGHRNPVEFDESLSAEEEKKLTRAGRKKNQKNGKGKNTEMPPKVTVADSTDMEPVTSMVTDVMGHGDNMDIVLDSGEKKVKRNDVSALTCVVPAVQSDHESCGRVGDLSGTSNPLQDNKELMVENYEMDEDEEIKEFRRESSSTISAISDLFFNGGSESVKPAPGKKKCSKSNENHHEDSNDEDGIEMSLLEDNRLWTKK